MLPDGMDRGGMDCESAVGGCSKGSGSCTMDRVSARPDEIKVEEVEMQPAAQLLCKALHQPVGRVPPGSAGAGGAAVEGAHTGHALQALVQAPICQVADRHRNL